MLCVGTLAADLIHLTGTLLALVGRIIVVNTFVRVCDGGRPQLRGILTSPTALAGGSTPHVSAQDVLVVGHLVGVGCFSVRHTFVLPSASLFSRGTWLHSTRASPPYPPQLVPELP